MRKRARVLAVVVALCLGTASARNNPGFALFSLGRREEAIASDREALRLDPADENARYNLRQAGAAP